MATQLNIKDPETVQLVKRYAAETGRTVTATVRAAIENDRRTREAAIAEKIRGAKAILEGARALWNPETENMTFEEVMNSIYDDRQPDGFAE